MDTPYQPDLVVYHDKCADGIVAAWACWKRWGDAPDYEAANYGFRPPADVADKHVLIVDMSYKPDVLRSLIVAGAASIVVLDHHKTALEDLEEFALSERWPGEWTRHNIAAAFGQLEEGGLPPIAAVFDMERSGARMAWSFAHGSIGDDTAPWLVELAETYDLWNFQPGTSDDAELLHLELQRMGLTIPAVEALHNELLRSRAPLDRGEVIYGWRALLIEEIASRAHRVRFGGHEDVLTVECPYSLVSSVGHHLLKHNPDAPFVACSVTGEDKITYSLRSDDSRADVSAVARSLGGGGHRNASGVRVNRIGAEDFVAWPMGDR
ncbi:MAG: DHHA1 domain-containing protein [Pseudomonadota bacterium]|nr:DHHA1 domain-containing protein [Pseudomonadota bacterium]